MCVKFGGACIEYLDWKNGSGAFSHTHIDLSPWCNLGRLAALPEVTFVGNPVVYLSEDDGTAMTHACNGFKTAALIARYTTKAGSTEVWNEAELKYLIELGKIVRGDLAATWPGLVS